MEKVVGSMSDWSGLLKDFFRQINDGSITLEMLKAVNEHRNPFVDATDKEFTEKELLRLERRNLHQNLVVRFAKVLSKRFGKKINVGPLPDWFTGDNLGKAAKFHLRPIFLPDEEIGRDRSLQNWVKLEDSFYQRIANGHIAKDSARLKAGWYLADFTLGADYDDGRQVFQSDPLSPIITRLRQAGQVGECDKTPMGSRFAIVPKDEWPLVLAELAKELGLKPEQVRLERAIEFNAIGNLYDNHRGQFKIWEWFDDAFEGSGRLNGGHRVSGGLAGVDCHWVGDRSGYIAGRPLVSF